MERLKLMLVTMFNMEEATSCLPKARKTTTKGKGEYTYKDVCPLKSTKEPTRMSPLVMGVPGKTRQRSRH